jgi:type I restriction enzyme S subunit
LAALVEAELPGAVYSGFLIRLRPRLEDLVNRFLMHFFVSDAFRKCLLPKSTISANTNINQGALGSLPVAMPGINEQRYIADVLDQLDQKLTTLTTQQTHYQSLKRGLMQKLLTREWRVRVPACGYNP